MDREIFELIETKQYGKLKDIFSCMNAADLAAIFIDVEMRDVIILFRILPKELAAELFVEMEKDMRKELILAFSDKELREVLSDLFLDDTVDIIEEMPAVVAKRILAHTNPDDRKMINQLLAYPEDSAGSIMTTEYVDLKRDMTVSQAFEKIRRDGTDRETIYTCYVIDASRHLIGIISAKILMLSDSETVIGDIMEENIIFASTLDHKEEVAQQFDKYDLLALPVVDKENRLVGIVTVDDAIDVIQEAATEDMEKMAAITPSDKSYLQTGVFETFKARIPWLFLLMISATLTGLIISSFESALSTVAVLTAFIPMLMGTGGNSGSQASVTVTRSLSLGDISFKDIFKVIWKECRVALLCGFALSVLNFIKILFFDRLYNSDINFMISLVVSLSLFVTVVVAKLIGCSLPIVAKKLGFDPAVMASPFITTIVDAISLALYFLIAKQVLF